MAAAAAAAVHLVYLVSIFDVVVGEVRRTPACDWVADVLRRTNDGSEDDEEQDGVAMVQPVYDVVVVAEIDLGDTGSGADDAVHDVIARRQPSVGTRCRPSLWRAIHSALESRI